MFSTGWLARLHKPGENPQIDPKLKEEHLRATGGKVFTRFPPEPNGFLHVCYKVCFSKVPLLIQWSVQIGHSKAIAVNFGYAKHHQGHCYLRFDDTNPEAEEQVYFDKILEAVRWLGYEPYKITYSSDHFQELFDLAIQLIKSGGAYTSNDTGMSRYSSLLFAGTLTTYLNDQLPISLSNEEEKIIVSLELNRKIATSLSSNLS